MITATASQDINFAAKGQKGARGAVLRGPQDWTSLPIGYVFQSGKEGEQWVDVILYDGQNYVCKTTHTKSATAAPGGTRDTREGLWQLGDKVDLVASKILLSEYAVIENLGASAIEMKNADGEVVFEAKDGAVKCSGGTFNNIDVQTGKIAGFEIQTVDDIRGTTALINKGTNNDSYIVIRNDAESVFMGVGGNVLPPSSGMRAIARFENCDNDTYGTHYAVIASAKNANTNIALAINGGCISGLAMRNQIISGTTSVYLERGVNNIVALGTGNVPIYLPQLQACDDGYVMRVQSLKDSGAMRIYTQNCVTKYGTGRAAIICYVNGNYTVVTTGYFDLSAPGYAMELVYFRDMEVTVSGTTYHGVWLQYKMPRDW